MPASVPAVIEQSQLPPVAPPLSPRLTPPPFSWIRTRPPSGDGQFPPLTLAARGLALLFAEGLSCGFAAWTLRAGPRLLPYVTGNDLPARGRLFLLANMAGGAAGACLGALIYLLVRRRRFPAAAQRVSDVGWRLGPLALVGLLPLLAKWQLWVGRELTMLAMTTAFALGLQGLTRAALQAPPLGLFGRWAARPRATLARFVTRHPRVVRRAPLTLVLLGAAGYAVFFAKVTIETHWNLRTSSLDLGLEDNLVWNALHWSRPFFKSSPLGGPEASHFGYHATFFSYLLALIYALAPRAETLLVFQAVMVAAASIPLFLYARRHLGPWTACLLAYVYLLYPPVHGANLYDFHYLPVGVFFLWLTLYALDARRPVLTVFAVLLTLSIREDVGAGLAIVGAYLLLTGQRPRAGLVVAALGTAYFITMKLVIMPRALQSSAFVWMYRDLLPSGEQSFGSVLKTVIGNPAYTLNTLLDRDKLAYVLQIFAPLAFLPLRRPVGLLCCLPGFFFTLLSTGYAPLIQTSFQYTANWTVYVFMAIVANLIFVGRPRLPGDTQGRIRQRAWLFALAAACLICSHQFGAVLQQNTVRGGFGPYIFGTTPADRINRQAVRALLAQVPRDAKIVASEMLVAHVSNRRDAYTLRIGVFDADYLLFALPAWGEERNYARVALRDWGFGVVEVRDSFVLAKRGQKPDKNAPILAQLQ